MSPSRRTRCVRPSWGFARTNDGAHCQIWLTTLIRKRTCGLRKPARSSIRSRRDSTLRGCEASLAGSSTQRPHSDPVPWRWLEVRRQCEHLGSGSPQDGTWEWAWSNTDLPPEFSTKSLAVNTVGERLGLSTSRMAFSRSRAIRKTMSSYMCSIGVVAAAAGVFRGGDRCLPLYFLVLRSDAREMLMTTRAQTRTVEIATRDGA